MDDEDRESAYGLLRRGQELLEDRHHAQAVVVLERALRLEPHKGSILEALGRAYYGSGQELLAAGAFESLLNLDPSNHYAHLGLGMALEKLGMYEDARAHLRLAAAMDPQNEDYNRILARVERALARRRAS
jgi:tetratricopeptide (TPR) repeat protein